MNDDELNNAKQAAVSADKLGEEYARDGDDSTVATEADSKSDTPMSAEQEFEINRAAEAGIDLRPFEGYTPAQLGEVRLAKAGAKKAFELIVKQDYEDEIGHANHYSYLQMRLLRKANEEDLPLESFAHPGYDPNQMWEIMEGIRDGIDIKRYALLAYSAEQMRQIRLGLLDGVETTQYENPDLSAKAMEEIRKHLRPQNFKKRWQIAMRELKGPGAKRKKRGVVY